MTLRAEAAHLRLMWHASFGDIKFDEASHTYTLDGEEYKSVSKYLDEARGEFDRERVARLWERSMRRKGIVDFDGMAALQERSDASRTLGKEVHKGMYHYVLGERHPSTSDDIVKCRWQMYDALHKYVPEAKRENIVALETPLCIKTVDGKRVAGTPDGAFASGSSSLTIIDYKVKKRMEAEDVERAFDQIGAYAHMIVATPWGCILNIRMVIVQAHPTRAKARVIEREFTVATRPVWDAPPASFGVDTTIDI